MAKDNGCVLFLSSTFFYREEIKYIRKKVSSGELTISGTGEMYDFSIDATAPWWKLVLNSVFNKSISIKNVTIENGVSSIGTNAFQSCEL